MDKHSGDKHILILNLIHIQALHKHTKTFNAPGVVIVLLIICVQYLWAYPRPHNCTSTVTSHGISFHGCEDIISTESITNKIHHKRLIYTFKGIPYAKPPVGALRFRKPVPIKHRKGTQVNAKNYKKPCMQSWIADHPFGVMSEDCLHLNVWTPTLNGTANLPVMIWIYGGSFYIGSSSQFAALYLTSDNIYEGTQLALRDVVIVTINYRLGIFGFLYGNTPDCPGNQGLWDQAMAIQWVKDNIKAFGGNPNDITLFGESAGSISISNHIVSNVTRNMFQKAIMQSGMAETNGSAYIKLFSRDTDYSYKIARKFASNKKLFRRSGPCVGDNDWIECLRTKRAHELLNAQLLSILHNPLKPWYTVWIQQFCPVFGDEFVPISPSKRGTSGKTRDVVIVTINYRLGIFGFLYGNTPDCPGNQGLWDQAMAIQWVKDNIKAFGGNPNDITLFGESAGSISISNHIVSNVTRNMFQKAIMQSGMAETNGSAYIKLFSRDTDYSYKIARKFASNKKLFRRSGPCVGDNDWIECLRTKRAHELLNAQLVSILHNPLKPWYTVWIQQFCPVFGDEFVPISVNKAVKEGNFRKDVRVLMGHVEMEGLLFASAFDLVVGMSGRYLPFVPIAPVISRDIVRNDIRKYFFDNDTIGVEIAHEFTKSFDTNPRLLDGNGLRRAAIHAFGDYFLTCPTI
ncbi:unnamed protein product, partial [Oppiella nova]